MHFILYISSVETSVFSTSCNESVDVAEDSTGLFTNNDGVVGATVEGSTRKSVHRVALVVGTDKVSINGGLEVNASVNWEVDNSKVAVDS